MIFQTATVSVIILFNEYDQVLVICAATATDKQKKERSVCFVFKFICLPLVRLCGVSVSVVTGWIDSCYLRSLIITPRFTYMVPETWSEWTVRFGCVA